MLTLLPFTIDWIYRNFPMTLVFASCVLLIGLLDLGNITFPTLKKRDYTMLRCHDLYQLLCVHQLWRTRTTCMTYALLCFNVSQVKQFWLILNCFEKNWKREHIYISRWFSRVCSHLKPDSVLPPWHFMFKSNDFDLRASYTHDIVFNPYGFLNDWYLMAFE